MKNMMIGLTVIVVIAVALFWKEVWGLFAGMTPLESLTQIVTFVLHVSVATIAVYAVTTLPELIKPWMRTFKFRQRQARRGGFDTRGRASRYSTSVPKGDKDAMLLSLVRELQAKNKSKGGAPAEHDPRIDMRF